MAHLYLTHQFFETKPVEILLDENIAASDITDHALGRALDEIAEYGSSKLFGEIAFEVAIENNLLGPLYRVNVSNNIQKQMFLCALNTWIF